MTSKLTIRRCCNQGCTNTINVGSDPMELLDTWYKSSYGFMSWACPEHAAAWRVYDATKRDYEALEGSHYDKALQKFETEWFEQYQLANPVPVPPESQSSLLD